MARSSMLFIILLLQVVLLASCTAKRTSAADDSISDSANGTNLGGIIIEVVAVLAGSGMVVVGYSTTGAVGIAVTTERMLVDKSFWCVGSWVAFVLGGAVCGGMAMWVHPKSNFIAGVAGGITLAMILINSAAYYILPDHTQELFTILCVVLAVVFAAFELNVGCQLCVCDFSFLSKSEKYSTQNANDDMVYTYPTGCSAIDDEFASFGLRIPMAVPYVENEKKQSANTAQESDFLPSSFRRGANVVDSRVRLQSPRIKYLQGARKEVEV
ncbi:unnamed protein product [Peronospora destructor]|uniref:Transmembrane protein 198 n=1 Tax=Peronospora destructor TaxID=86335 RepID=A0AAV0VFX9_9STRA|nr:unnamed protein product [Peronospora destructor]